LGLVRLALRTQTDPTRFDTHTQPTTQGGGRGGRQYSHETLESVAAFDEEEIPHELIEGK
jgi:hypothetical protein